jgi:outer membrane receptor protein involved in Fe transport
MGRIFTIRRTPTRVSTVGWVAWGIAVAGVAGLAVATPSHTAAQEPPDSVARDTVAYVLPPLEVAVERERSAPPPVGALTIDPAALRAAQAPDAYRLLRRVAGLEVRAQGQGPGYASNVVMRGFTSDHSSDVLLVIDGVPVNLPAHGHVEGYADWNVLMSSSVSSLRVLHGNASPLYGDFALAGTVEVFTRADAERTEAMLGGTHFGDLGGWLTTGRRSDAGGLFVGGEGRRTEGWRAGSGHWLANGLVRGWRAVAGGRLEGGLSLYRTEWDSPGFVAVPDFNASRFDDPVDGTDGGRSRRALVHARFARPLSSTMHVQAVAWGLASDYSLFLHVPGHAHGGTPGSLQQSGEWDERAGLGGQLEAGFATGSGDIVIGASARMDDVDYRHAATLEREVVNPEVGLDARHRAAALYGRWRWSPTPRLGLDVGARWDVLTHESRSDFDEDGVWVSATNSVFAPKLGLRYELDGPWSVHATTARGFRSPVGIIGDPTREPYLAWSHELGVAWTTPAGDVELTGFRADVDNERVFDPITLTSTGAGESTRQGVEAHVKWELPRGVAAEIGGSWTHARLSGAYVDAHDDHPHEVFQGDSTVPSADDDARRIPGLADWTGRVRLSAPVSSAIEARVDYDLMGPHVPIGEPTVRTQSYSVLDLGVSWAIGDGRTVDVEVGNLFDVRYVELRSAGFVTPGEPRALRARIRLADLPF